MKLLTHDEIVDQLKDNNFNTLFIEPLLADDQIGSVSIDIRLGYDFLVSILTRKPAIDPCPIDDERKRGIQSYFQETRRQIGDRFVLYPNQVVLSTSLEYISLPDNIYAEITTRSSYSRLGVSVTTTLQPGWRGSIPLELFNHGNSPVEMVVGSRICQVRLFQIDSKVEYVTAKSSRKYFGAVRPTVSRADKDQELERLTRISKCL